MQIRMHFWNNYPSKIDECNSSKPYQMQSQIPCLCGCSLSKSALKE
jgi:hypothetical protein